MMLSLFILQDRLCTRRPNGFSGDFYVKINNFFFPVCSKCFNRIIKEGLDCSNKAGNRIH